MARETLLHLQCSLRPEREGQEGWLFTEPMSQELSPLPGPGKSEKGSVKWLPEVGWDKKQQKMGQPPENLRAAPGYLCLRLDEGFLQPSRIDELCAERLTQGRHHRIC